MILIISLATLILTVLVTVTHYKHHKDIRRNYFYLVDQLQLLEEKIDNS